MIHFIIDCPNLEADRNQNLIDPNLNSSQEKMIDLLFSTNKFREVGSMIRKMWHRRRRLLAFLKKRKEKNLLPKNVVGTKYPPLLAPLKSDPGPVRVVPVSHLGRSL